MLECSLLLQSLISKNFYAIAAALLRTTVLSIRPLYCNFTCHFMKPAINENIYEQQIVIFSCQVSATKVRSSILEATLQGGVQGNKYLLYLL